MIRDRARTADEDALEILAKEVQQISEPLKTREDLDPLIERIGDARLVLLGEASHGTSEFYQWRARLSSRLIAFKRWPTWMWANWEIVAFTEWMQRFNKDKSRKAGFYGLDVYSLWESMESILPRKAFS